jgi:hypothetical protein
MQKNVFLIITSIASSENKALRIFAKECFDQNIGFIVVGDTKSPSDFFLENCDYYSIERQKKMPFKLSESLPTCMYSRKNIGYLTAIKNGAEIIIETDDDNFPGYGFWDQRDVDAKAYSFIDKGWVNVYKYFTEINVWPRGFALERLCDLPVDIDGSLVSLYCPVQQGLADDNPDVDAIYRLTSNVPVKFNDFDNISLGYNSWCPFNSQNTTWFKEAFPLLYLPSFCSFRMTDIWRSFIAQRIAWTNNWNILFHKATVFQDRNEHDFLFDFQDEIPGYLNNGKICNELLKLDLMPGTSNIFENLKKCYQKIISMGLISSDELTLLDNWIDDCKELL